MPIDNLLLADFMSAFKGSPHNYGRHVYKATKKGEKEEGESKTIRNTLITKVQYEAHLDGKVGFGIIPIDTANKCSFCVIDIDLYTADLKPYVKAIEDNGFPLVPFRSKSGGLHLYIFFRSPIVASTAIDLTRQLISLLSIDLLVKQEQNKVVEVFPKQFKLKGEDVGSWVNLPYFNSEETKQYAIRDDKPLTLSEALQYIKEKKVTTKDLKTFIDDVPFADGPPCLQSIHTLNPLSKESGGRNVYLFTFGVYLKKKDEKLWEQKLHEINQTLDDPIPDDELERTIISSLRKKDYTYKCFEHPCLTFCDRPACKQREFGIGKDGGYFSELEFGKLTQIQTGLPYYEWEVKQQNAESFATLRFQSEDEIIRQDVFLRLCFRELHVLPSKMKQSEWFKLVNQSLIELEVNSVPTEEDTSPVVLLRSLVSDWLMNRAKAATRDQILSARVYYDQKSKSYLFRGKDLLHHLFFTKNFRFYTPNEIHGFLRDLEIQSRRIRTERGRQFRVSTITKVRLEEVFGTNGHVDEPEFKVDFEALEKKEEKY